MSFLPVMTKAAGILVFALALLAAGRPAEAWGFTAHRLVNRQATHTLPSPLRELFEGNEDYVAEHAIDPDLWRAAGRTEEGPNHFMDLDAFGEWPFPEVPRDEAAHLARFGPDAREKGRAPWRAAEVYRELVEAFRAKDEARALERAAVLGHYVGDAHVPLHGVLNYDGQLTGQTGLHVRWESTLVDRFLRQIEAELLPGNARTGADPVALTFEALRESAALAGETLEADLDVRGPRDFAATPEDDRYGDAYYSLLFEREGARLAARLSLAAERLGSLWLSAWVEAGRPALDPKFRWPYVRGQSRLIVASLDGAGAPLIDNAVARGLMPHLAALRAEGATAAGAVTSWPAKTASGHATFYTGAWPSAHGVTGNEVVLPGDPLVQSISGYRSEPLRAEPLWVTAARQGLEATMLCATQDFPYAPYQEERRFGGNYGRSLTFITGYKGLWLVDAVYGASDLKPRAPTGWRGTLPAGAREVEFSAGESSVYGLLYDDPADPVRGFDRLALSLERDLETSIRLKPGETGGADAFAPLTIRHAGQAMPAYFRLFALSPDGEELLLYRARTGAYLSNRAPLPDAVTRATGGFVGNGAATLYGTGAFGPTLAKGGDGTAERRYLETARLVARQFERLLDFGAERTRWHVLVGYLPFPDEFLHLWLGHLDPSLPGHDPALARRLRPFLDEGLLLADGYVGALRRHADARTVVAVGADHGMAAIRTRVRVNALLREAGLLQVDAGGRVDPAKSLAFHLDGSGYILINRAARSGGRVAEADEAGVRARVEAALRSLRDPDTGKPLVVEVFAPGAEPGTGGPHGGDVYFSLAPHAFPTGALGSPVVESGPPRGEHLLAPRSPEMHAAFAVAGAGVAKGAALGVVRQVDVAPTLAALLGLEPPAQAQGERLPAAFAPSAFLADGW